MQYYDFTARSFKDLYLTVSAFTALRTKVILETLRRCSKSHVLFPNSTLVFSSESIIETNHVFWSKVMVYTFCKNHDGIICPDNLWTSAQAVAKYTLKKNPRVVQSLRRFACEDVAVSKGFAKDATSMAELTSDILPYFAGLLDAEVDTYNIIHITSVRKMFEKYHLYFWYVIAKGLLPIETLEMLLTHHSRDAALVIISFILQERNFGEAERVELSKIVGEIITLFFNELQPRFE